MRASYNWIRELCGVDATVSAMAERLTRAGLEVEGVHEKGANLRGVIAAEVRGRGPHPKREGLSVVRVWDGHAEVELVCGADNVPDKGGLVWFAAPGTVLPDGRVLEKRAVAGVDSAGMLCSEAELDLGPDQSGLLLIPGDAKIKPGQALADVLPVRDAILEIGLTPNRPDALGHLGLAREVALLWNQPFRAPSVAIPEIVRTDNAWTQIHTPDVVPLFGKQSESKTGPKGVNSYAIRLEDAERCPRYAAARVIGAHIGPSPFWLRYRLHILGLRPIHNVVDVTNWVCLEYGHPVHAFDASRLRGRAVVIRRARDGELMKTLDGVERVFVADDLLICDAERPVAIAGVMGGEDSGIQPGTEDVVIESAYFDARSVRRTARRLGLHTDASHRFERGVDPNAVRAVLQRTASLIAQVSGGSVVDTAADVYPKPIARSNAMLSAGHMSALLGYTIPAEETTRILTGLGCEVARAGDDYRVEMPTFRPDLKRPVDLIEEVVRVHGYDRIPVAIPNVRPSAEGTSPRLRFMRRLEEAAAFAGLIQAINYSFVSLKELELCRVPTDCVALANPLSDERSVMRTSLLPGLVSSARQSRRHQVDRIALFELGRTFHSRKAAELPLERTVLGVLLAGPSQAWLGDGPMVDFYDGKGAISGIVQALLGQSVETVFDASVASRSSFLHPRKCASLHVNGKSVGVLGELHPDVVEAVELDIVAVYAELDVDILWEVASALPHPKASPLPRFPSAVRDLAIVVEEAVTAAAVVDVLRAAAGDLAEEVRVFDVYRGEPIPKGRKSLAFRVVYRDPEKTLTDERVNQVHASVIKAAEIHFQAQLRS